MGFDDEMQIYTCQYEIQSSGFIQHQTIQAPRIMHERQFMTLVEQAARSRTPTKIKMSRQESMFDQYSQAQKNNEYSIVYANNAYINEYGEN